MAVPDTVTLKDLNGSFVINKSLSDSIDPILALQGVSWITRKALGAAPITLKIKEYVDSEGKTHIDIANVVTGIQGTDEQRKLDYQWREHSDWLFGKVRGRSRWIQLNEDLKDDDEDQAFLKKGWSKACYETEAIESYVESIGGGWTAWQVWGFEDGADGKERRYVRHVVVRKGDEVKRARLVYNFLGRNEE